MEPSIENPIVMLPQSLILSFSQREKERGLGSLSLWERVGVRGGDHSRMAKRIMMSVVLMVVLSMAAPVQAEKVVPESRAQAQLSYAPLIREVAPAVVNIYTKRTVRQSRSMMFDDPVFQRFFGDRFSFGPQRERQQHSLGSGVLVGEGGIVITNGHVIAGADEITVVLNDRREFEAELILSDDRTDLAVLRIDAGDEDLPYLAFEDSDDIEVGDLVFAIGNPFGVGQTVTSGIVSAVARTEVGVNDYEFFIQTDAAINPGNSGGALVGLDGKLYGINTVILSRSGGSHGVGFAIPANMVSRVVESALTDGKVIRPWFGASGQTVTADIADSLGLERPSGVLINSLYDGGPADESGLEIGDVVLEIEGREVVDPKSLASRLATRPVGGTATLLVYRNGRTNTVDIALRAAPEDPPRNITTLANGVFAGATIANLSPALAEELGMGHAMMSGVIVLEVERRSQAARLGLRPGDLFVAINDETIEDVATVDAYWSQYDDRMTVEIERAGRVLSATVRP